MVITRPFTHTEPVVVLLKSRSLLFSFATETQGRKIRHCHTRLTLHVSLMMPVLFDMCFASNTFHRKGRRKYQPRSPVYRIILPRYQPQIVLKVFTACYAFKTISLCELLLLLKSTLQCSRYFFLITLSFCCFRQQSGCCREEITLLWTPIKLK